MLYLAVGGSAGQGAELSVLKAIIVFRDVESTHESAFAMILALAGPYAYFSCGELAEADSRMAQNSRCC